jgi:nicotinamide mononucleotide transporter
MSIYGWYKWSRKPQESDNLPISRTNKKRKIIGIVLFLVTIFVVFGIYKVFNYEIHNDNYIDIVASGIFFTGMWYMALKKNRKLDTMDYRGFNSNPLYAYRGLGILSLQYLIFTILAISAYLEWKKILNSKS